MQVAGYSSRKIRTFSAVCTIGMMMGTGVVAQEGTAPPAEAPVATAMLNIGWAEAQLFNVREAGPRFWCPCASTPPRA